MKKVGTILWWGQHKTQRNYGIVEVKNADCSIEKYFLHRKNFIKCVPDLPSIDMMAVFDVSPEPPLEGKLREGINIEIYQSKEQMLMMSVQAQQTAQEASVSKAVR
jgi:hypothetical protein